MSRNNIINKIIIGLIGFTVLCIISCSSTYRIPDGSKVVISKEQLHIYNPKNFSKKRKSQSIPNEDELIIKAIWLEEQHNYKESNKIYSELYDKTHKEEYLFKELTTANYAGIISKNIPQLKRYISKHPNNLKAKRLLLYFNLKDKNFNKAKAIGEKLIEQSNQAIDYELTANPYIFTADYPKAVSLLEKAYQRTKNEDILLKIVAIEINYLHQADKAIERLEKHRKYEGCSEKICLQLISIYLQQNRIDKLIPIYKSLAIATKKEVYIEKLIESYLYNKDIKGAIDFLEKDYHNDTLLYSLYMENKAFNKAHLLAQKLLKTTNDPKWQAESAVSLYESLMKRDDKTEINRVIQEFEKALDSGVRNPVYLNYYGYTLIDEDINVKKGIKIIKQALVQEPENTYFLDSLAWGEYKLGECSKAYKTMKKVVEVEGLKEKEIIEHWNAINSQCKTTDNEKR